MIWKKRAVGVLALAILILAGGASGGPAAEAGDEPAVRDVTARLLRTLTPEQLDDYLAGTSPSAIVLSNGETLEGLTEKVLDGDDLEVAWFTVDGGGAQAAAGGELRLASTVGQPDAAVSRGGRYTQQGGFWAVLREQDLFADGFESGELSFWSSVVGDGASVRPPNPGSPR